MLEKYLFFSLLFLGLVLVSIIATVTSVAAEDEEAAAGASSIRRLTVDEYSKLFSFTEGPLRPCAVHFSLPWAPLNSSSAFVRAAEHFPGNVVSFAELVIDNPDALAIADLFAVKIPSVQLINGQQTRHEQMVNTGALPFGDAPYDIVTNINGADSSSTAFLSSEVDIVRYVAKSLPRTVFSKLDHTEMPSVVRVATLADMEKYMDSAEQKEATLVVMQPTTSAVGHKQQQQVKLGREWVSLAAVSAGAQFVGRDGGLVFLLDGTVVTEDDAAAKELSVSSETLKGTCGGGASGSNSACFDVVRVSRDASAKTPKTSSRLLISGGAQSSDIGKIVSSVQELTESTQARADYIRSVVSKHTSSRNKYARVFEPLLATATTTTGEPAPVETDLVRSLYSTTQFRSELHQSRGGLFVLAFIRPSDIFYERQLKSINELAAALYRDRSIKAQRGAEMRAEFFTVDTDIFPGAAAGFQAAQVPSMFVVLHLENNAHAVAQYKGEFSVQKLKDMEKFIRESAFDSKNLAQLQIDKVSFESKMKKISAAEQREMAEKKAVRHSFMVPYQQLEKQLKEAKVLVSLDSATLISGKSAEKKKESNADDDKNRKKAKETPEQEAKRLQLEAAEKKKEAEKKKKLEAELEAKRKAKEDKIRLKKQQQEELEKKKAAETKAKLQQIKEEVAAGKRVRKVTKEDIRARREKLLQKQKPAEWNVYRQEKLDAHQRKEAGFVGQVFVEGDQDSEKVTVKDVIW